MDTLGLGYEELTADNPGLIYVSMTPFGQTGPYKDFKASDLVGFAMGGYMYITGWPHTPPNKLWGSQAYTITSNRAFTATLLALYDRLNTGLGQQIDVAMQEAVAATTEIVNTAYNYEGKNATRCGFRHGGHFIATWRCKDGYFSLITNSRRAWDDLRGWMAQDGMVGDLLEEKYDDYFILRGEHSGPIEELIQKWALLHTRQEITDWGQDRHHPWGPAATSDEILDNSQLWERGFFIESNSPESNSPRDGTRLVYPGPPYKLSETPWQLRSSAPSVGQHNAEVYCGELGLSAGDLELLASARTI
jgi:crotonobetainyl-CoA:carnitine CoA-transferase CaiB-like acyl-CoA transferase